MEVRPSRAPTSSAIPKEETDRAMFQLRIHFSSFFLPRYSIATTRRIRKTSARVRGMYRAEKRAAYQMGNAAKIAAPPDTIHTSLPSQTGPMVFSSRRRSFSFLVNLEPISIPTPRSKPSRIMYMMRKTPMATNQRVGRPG